VTRNALVSGKVGKFPTLCAATRSRPDEVAGVSSRRPTLALDVPARRPAPPVELLDQLAQDTFVVAQELRAWLLATFIVDGGPLVNETHAHLRDAHLGVLWTNAVNQRHMRVAMATAEIPMAMGGGWKRARHDFQLREWFGSEPDFLLTFSAPLCASLDDRAFCALAEHELLHCAQAVDEGGNPKFSRTTGLPIFALKGHDVEEFTDIVRRYGVVSPDVRDLVRAANEAPEIAGPAIDIACGVCLARAA
jgi:hypothetical protein